MKRKPVYNFFKRLFDIFCSFIGIILFIIPFIVIAIIIKFDSKGKVFFIQKRVGKNKKLFKIIKFRTMYPDTDPNVPTHLMKDVDSHTTKVGGFIRRTYIDELPQLFNIFIGQMSFVGPRPALWNQDDLIGERDKYHANEVKPGLTGLAQIRSRLELPIETKAKLDGEYISKRGFFYDIGLIFKTIAYLFKREGAVEGGTGEIEKDKANK